MRRWWVWLRPGPRCSPSPSVRPARRARSSPMRVRAAPSLPSSCPRTSSSEPTRSRLGETHMAEVLVLVEHLDGVVRKTALELLTIARRLGEPSAVFIGCLLYTSDAADEEDSVDLGGRR